MSNPAVITLAKTRTSIGEFRVEDNLGESIHFHIGEIRCDLTISELESISESVKTALERFIGVEGFKVDLFSTEFLLQKAEWLPDLEAVKDDTIKLNSIYVDTYNSFGFQTLKPLSHSRVIKALNGDTFENDKKVERNYYGQTNQNRLIEMLESIKANGYPYNNQKIVLLNNNNQIFDGQHRAACLYYLFGDKEIPITRLYFSNKEYGKFKPIRNKLFYWDKYRVMHNLLRIPRIARKIKNKLKRLEDAILYNYDKLKYRNVI